MDLGDAGIVVLQELWKSVITEALELSSEINDVVLEKESFKEFGRHITQLSIVFEALHANSNSNSNRVETTSLSLASTTTSLQALQFQLNKARTIIQDYKAGSRLWLMLNSHSLLNQMQKLSNEIAGTISLLELANTDAALYLKSETDKIVNNLRSIEFSSRTSTEAIASEIEKSMTSHVKNRDHTVMLLHKIAEACGTSMGAALVQSEISLLKQEKEEMEAQKKQAEALQFSQLIQLLYSSEIVSCPPEEELNNYSQNSIESFTCPLCNQVMTDPVAILCGHSFERKAIQEHFGQGADTCPICKQELSSFELTPNLSLRGSIEEWKQRDIEMKFQAAVSGITSADHEIVKKSMENLQELMEMERYKAIVSEMGLITKIIELLHRNNSNTPATLKCLYHLSCHCDDNKEIMVKAGAVSHILKSFYRGEANIDAIAILLELSTKETIAETIGSTKDSIPVLVSILHSHNHDVAETAKMVLENLSSNTYFVIKMAEAGYFKPFVSRFNEGTFETRASMAAALVKIQIGDNNINSFEHPEFISKLIEMLALGSPAYIMACLKCMKELLLYPKMVEWFLAENTTIPHLINLISHVSTETHWKLESTEVLTSLVENLELSSCPKYPNLQELESQQNVTLFMNLVTTSEPQLKIKLLQLLFLLARTSEKARNLVRSNKDAVNHLFCYLNSDQNELRQEVMKLIYSVSENHPAGVPLPPAPAKECAIKALVAILNSSPDNNERSAAAGIISHLPTNDIIIDEILRRSEGLKAIQGVLHAVDNELCGIKPHVNRYESLLENTLAALLRYTQPTKPDLQRQVCELEMYPSLVRILSNESSLAKEYAATALAHLSQSANEVINDTNIISNQSNNAGPLLQPHRFFPNIFCCYPTSTKKKSMCSVHGSSCSSRHTFCLVKADAVRPLIQTLSETQSGAAQAALTALNTMLNDNRTLSLAANVIVNNQGVAAILQVLEKGTVSAKEEALKLFHKILEQTEITSTMTKRAERILIHLLTDNALKKRTALVLRQMNILPEQSSYF